MHIMVIFHNLSHIIIGDIIKGLIISILVLIIMTCCKVGRKKLKYVQHGVSLIPMLLIILLAIEAMVIKLTLHDSSYEENPH